MENEMVVRNEFQVAEFAENAMENLAGITLEFPQLKIPTGGSLFFDVDEEPVKETVGVIVAHGPMHSYYATEFDGTNNPPDCFSRDGVTGNWRVAGEEDETVYESRDCATCPFSKFGSDKNGGKACKEKHQLYILMSGQMIPYTLMLPVSSAGVLNTYATKLFTRGQFLGDVVTSFTLEKATNKTNIVYSKIVMKKVRDLTAEEKTALKKTVNLVRQANGQN